MKRNFNSYLIKVYNYLIKTSIINSNNKICRKIRSVLFHNICFECYAHFGKKNPERLFYLIRCPQETMGLFGLYNYVVMHIDRAVSLGAEPVVDWQFYPNASVIEDNAIGRENAWEYFFEQCVKISLKEIYQSHNVIMSGGEGMLSLSEVYDQNLLRKSSELIKKYIRLNTTMQEQLNEVKKELNMTEGRILGVLARGTDFSSTHPKGHSICATAEETISKVYEKEEEWGRFDKIFLATEDAEIYQALKKAFGERLICNQVQMLHISEKVWLNQLYETKEFVGRKRSKAQEYLIAIYLLAECDGLIAPVVGGTLGAMRIKGGYDLCYLFQKGIYG